MPPIGGQNVQYIRTLHIYCNTLLACFTLSLWGQLTDEKMKNKQWTLYDCGEIPSLILGVLSVCNGCEGAIFLTLLWFSQTSEVRSFLRFIQGPSRGLCGGHRYLFWNLSFPCVYERGFFSAVPLLGLSLFLGLISLSLFLSGTLC